MGETVKFSVTSFLLIKSFFLFSTEVTAGLREGAELREVLIASPSLNSDLSQAEVLALLLQGRVTVQNLRAITPSASDTPDVVATKLSRLHSLQAEFQTEIDALEPEIEQVKKQNATSWKTIGAVTIPALLCSVISGELGENRPCSVAQYAVAFSVGFWVYGVGEQAVRLILRKVEHGDHTKRYNARVAARDRVINLLRAHRAESPPME